jgi:hypothetical protein
MNKLVNTLSHIGDIAAIPMFGWAIHYFYTKKNKTIQENILLWLAVLGLIVDTFFTFHYLRK